MQYCVLYHYTNVVVLTFGAIDLIWSSGWTKWSLLKIKPCELWGFLLVSTLTHSHHLYCTTTPKNSERERGAYDVTVAVAVKEAEQVEKVGHYPFKEKHKQK